MRISIFYYFIISTVLPDSNAAALFDDMNWSNILHAFGLDEDDHRDHFLPMMTYTGYRNYNPQKRNGPIDFSTYLMQNDEMLSDMGLLKELQDIMNELDHNEFSII